MHRGESDYSGYHRQVQLILTSVFSVAKTGMAIGP